MVPLLLDAMEKPATVAIGRGFRDRPIIDSWNETPGKNIALLSIVGLADAFTWARTYAELSDGQKARWNIADLLRDEGQVCIFDDFTNGLDRTTAKAVAWTLQKAARKRGKTIIALTPHEDIDRDLQPDITIRTNWQNAPEVEFRQVFFANSSLDHDITYERGTILDWHALSALHYAAGDPATTHSYHVLRHPNLKHPAAVAVVSYPDLHSAARNLATDDAFRIGGSRQQAMRLNREVLKLSRIVVAPELRSIGLAQTLIENILGQVNCRYFECTTSMGRYSPFLTRLGFREIPQTSHTTEAELAEFIEANRIPQAVLLDPQAFAAQAAKMTVRKARKFRKVVWLYYHHFVLHRRTRKPVPKQIPSPNDERWSEAWEIAAKRALERPAYFILGPIDGLSSSVPSMTSHSNMSQAQPLSSTTSSNPTSSPYSIQKEMRSITTVQDRQLPPRDRLEFEDPSDRCSSDVNVAQVRHDSRTA